MVIGCFLCVPVLFLYAWSRKTVRESYRRTLGLQPSKSLLKGADGYGPDDSDYALDDPDFKPGDVVRGGHAIEPDWAEADAIQALEGTLQEKVFRSEAMMNTVSDTQEEAAAALREAMAVASPPASPMRDPRGEIEDPVPPAEPHPGEMPAAAIKVVDAESSPS
mmetsp:Transcript_64940/g.174583  ORF Transcript_64940/g.174583 Transcript_64940/m.174583 type:complete len:164 (+) Transcript_64940:3-494(+)